MSLVSSRMSLRHRCTIERDTNADSPDSWGAADSPVWATNLTDLACRLAINAGRETVDATTSVVIQDIRLIVTLDTDVTERDRVGDVTDRGATILAGPTGIRAVLRHQDHIELVLVRLS